MKYSIILTDIIKAHVCEPLWETENIFTRQLDEMRQHLRRKGVEIRKHNYSEMQVAV